MKKNKFKLNNHWTTQELVTIGVFAAVIKATTLLVAYFGGGMNPLTLMAKNCVFAILMIVLLHKVSKTGTLTLATGITSLVSLLLMGQGILYLPAAIITCLFAELFILMLGGYTKTRNIVLGVLLFELGSKCLSLFIAWLSMREQPGMLVTVVFFVAIGSIGTFIGLGLGVRFMKELRHAGIISN